MILGEVDPTNPSASATAIASKVRSSAARMCFIPTVAGGPTVFCATSASR